MVRLVKEFYANGYAIYYISVFQVSAKYVETRDCNSSLELIPI